MTNLMEYAILNECIEENVLKDFFVKQKGEVIAMSIFEYDEEAVLDYIGQKQREDGRAEGMLFQQVATVRKSILKGKSVELIAEFVDLDIEAVCMIAEYVSGNPAVTDDELVEWYCNNK